MATFIDRQLQKQILNLLTNHYPNAITSGAIGLDLFPLESNDYNFCNRYTGGEKAYTFSNPIYKKIIQNLAYLYEHKYVSLKPCESQYVYVEDGKDPEEIHMYLAKILAPGIDFLEDDGGLSAIHRERTIRIHTDSIREILQIRINESPDLTAEEKSSWVEKLKSLNEASLEHLTLKGLDYALDHGGEGISWLGKWLGI